MQGGALDGVGSRFMGGAVRKPQWFESCLYYLLIIRGLYIYISILNLCIYLFAKRVHLIGRRWRKCRGALRCCASMSAPRQRGTPWFARCVPDSPPSVHCRLIIMLDVYLTSLVLHGDGSHGDLANRWFDKSYQVC